MSELQKATVLSELYVLESSDDSLQSAKSQFAEEHDVSYYDLMGKIVEESGYGHSYPRYAVVVYEGETNE